jgi:type III pantothenate kinase
MLLTIDVGNTRTKWALFNAAGEIQQQAACLNQALATADLSASALGYMRIIISNVAGPDLATLLTEKLSPYARPIHWMQSTAQAAGLVNSYTPSASLGSDRWAALIAAWHIKRAPCVVVNAGTAVTIDALSIDSSLKTGRFIGGLILPGLDLMQHSLGAATAQLPKGNTEIQKPSLAEIFATSTTAAIYAGAIFAVLGAITQMAQALQQHSQQTPAVIISGGNAALIYQQLKQTHIINGLMLDASIVDTLVLQGLYLADRFMQGENA